MPTPPIQHRNSDTSAFGSSSSGGSPFFAVSRASTIGSSSVSTTKSLLNPSSNAFHVPASHRGSQSSINFNGMNYGGDEGRQYTAMGIRNNTLVNPQGVRGYSGSESVEALSPSEQSVHSVNGNSHARNSIDHTHSQMRSNTAPYPQFGQSTVSWSTQRPSHSTHPSLHSESPAFDDRYAPQEEDYVGSLNRMHVGSDEAFQNDPRRPSLASHSSYDSSALRSKFVAPVEEGSYQGWAAYSPETNPQGAYRPNVPRNAHYVERGLVDAAASEYRRASLQHQSSNPGALNQYRSSARNGVQSRSVDQHMVLDPKLLYQHQEHQNYLASRPIAARTPYAQSQYEYPLPEALRMNPLAAFYAQNPYQTVQPAALAQTVHGRESSSTEVSRSPLLEEFRTNNKSNKRYELKVRTLRSLRGQSFDNCRTSMTTLSNSAAINMGRGSSNKSLKQRTAMKRSRFSRRSQRIRSSS